MDGPSDSTTIWGGIGLLVGAAGMLVSLLSKYKKTFVCLSLLVMAGGLWCIESAFRFVHVEKLLAWWSAADFVRGFICGSVLTLIVVAVALVSADKRARRMGADIKLRLAAARPPIAKAPTKAIVRAPERIFVQASAEQIWANFQGKTSAQAQVSVAIYIGKWKEFSGSLGDVKMTPGGALATFKAGAFPSVVLGNVYMNFSDRRFVDRLLVMQSGESIRVIGEIETIHSNGIVLQNCELT